ncbi:hypothetical protein WICANDRAFT_60021 [Wickerhamomyces anomalus NRRL Y-366-8]|uniref:C2 domain-containing protein n=1 Tax=Wickerhamomyces anomalus (strain ATCC 58044 / CBS 1984 / NCYC 433 / NRRL Y-366-8) TaxID=683960 RepID=A0A1E3PAP8_WICAA|nr:uncharacterized protein WICANDRAFT_60021 [Wickerhamomyces anomalus NRRL Y-366-8]ODQ61947.1 hypothetical protein WICANDRAFT_60021 [Wickerhamomyces anomalus NRRL Y-366-8]
MQSKDIARVQNTGARVTSVSSNTSALSIGSTLTLENHLKPKQYDSDPHAVYEAVLKVILLEYKNEPRFKIPTRPPSSQGRTSPSPASSARSSTPTPAKRDRSPNKHSWFHNKGESDPELLPKDTIPALKKQLGRIAVGKDTSVKDPLSKRCLLHLYNELLDPKSGRIEKAEELTVVFVRLATKEIQLYTGKTDLKNDVYHQTGVFVNILIGILRTQKNGEVSIRKLEDYRNSLKPSNHLKPTDSRGSEAGVTYLKPSYRLSEISSAQILGSLFSVDDVKLQQDIIRLKEIATEPYLYADLNKRLSLLKSNEDVFNPDSFDSHDGYFAWKKTEDKELRTLIESIPLVEAHKTKVSSNDFTFIPIDTRDALVELLARVLEYEHHQNSEETIISNATKDIVEKCCLYWRINPISQACLLYQASHLSILKSTENELNAETTEYLFGAFSRLLGDSDARNWSKPDKKLWITNLSNTYIQVMASVRSLLTAIYGQKAPKLTPILRVFYTYIEPDPLYEVILKSGLPQKWMKRLKNTLLSTTEQKYIDILKIIPTDSSLDLVHVKEASEGIYKQTQLLQKKFPKPLLDEIYIANEAAYLFIKLFSEDVSNMLAHIEHYSVKSGKSVNYADALETYQELKYLRDIYSQVAPKNAKFTLNLEKFFFKYLDELCSMSARKMLPVVQEAIQHDAFEPLDLNNGSGYSSSVLDIFKMINETFTMFKSYGWQNEVHLAEIYTKLLKAASDALVYYSARMMNMIIGDLSEEQLNAPSAATKEQNRKSGAWIFNEMKAAVSNASSKIEAPEPFNFQSQTCVVLNNLSEMLKMLTALEAQVDPESISSKVKNIRPDANKPLSNLFTIRVKNAENIKPCGSDGFSSSSVVLIDGHLKKEIGKTKIVPKSLNPVWNEEFEVETTSDNLKVISATVWDHSSKFGSHDLCGRALVQLDPKKFRTDGIPEEITRDLDIQGSISFEVSLESEKNDAIFSIGRAHRSLNRTMERAYALIVDKFSKFITYSFSRATLKSICGSNGARKPTNDESYDAIVPLFDYLNLNLQVLATVLNNDILLKVMVQAWKIVLTSADNLLLPALASVKNTNILAKSSATWQNSFSNAVANVTNSVNIPGFGRALSHNEVDTIFVWLNALCYDFFHNDGAGPPLEQLKNESYQGLLLIPVYYDRDVVFLKSEVDRLTPIVLKSIREKNFLGDDSGSNIKKRSNTIARSKTILAYGSAKRREEVKKAIKDSDQDTGHFQISTEDIILRVLLAKDQKEFVARRLKERERIAKSIATERLARLAVEGRNGR